MLEPGRYIIRDLAYGRYIGRSTIEENNWDPKIIYSLEDCEVACSGYPMVSSRRYSLELETHHIGQPKVGGRENPTTRVSTADRKWGICRP